jgi:hypothetical protein
MSEVLLVSVLTIVMSGVVAAVVTARLTARRQWLESRRQKLEDFFVAFTGYSRQLGSNALPYVRAMQELIDFNQALDSNLRDRGEAPRHGATLQMLAAIHFPELQSNVNHLLRARSQWNQLYAQFKSDYERLGPHRSAHLEAALSFARELDEIDAQFVKDIRLHAARLNGRLRTGAW